MVERAAMLASQVFTAKEQMLRDTVADLRVAMLLFDSTIETLMYRRIQNDWLLSDRFSGSDEIFGPRIQVDLADLEQKDREDAAERYASARWAFSKAQRQSIDREFGGKVAFLMWAGVLPPVYGPVINRLHEYRNEIYHRDHLRLASLRLTVHMAALVVSEMLRLLTPMTVGYGSDADKLIAAIHQRAGLPAKDSDGNPLKWFDVDLQSLIADQLLVGVERELTDAPELLAAYVEDRMETLHGDLDFIGDFAFSGRPKWNEFDVIRLLYSDFTTGFDGLSKVRPPMTRAMLKRWDAWPEKLRATADALGAFTSLAAFESEFEKFETKVHENAMDVDREIQWQIDVARGK